MIDLGIRGERVALHATLLDIITPHELPVLLHTIVERAVRMLEATAGGLYLCDPIRRVASARRTAAQNGSGLSRHGD
jgi:hypothetical protein